MNEIYKAVQADLEARAKKGVETYGSHLTSKTPVDLLWYAYEEMLDAAIYVRGEIERRKEERQHLCAHAYIRVVGPKNMRCQLCSRNLCWSCLSGTDEGVTHCTVCREDV